MHYIWDNLRARLKHLDVVAWAALIVSCAALYTSLRQTSVMTEALTSSDRNRLVEQAMESTFAICDQFSALAEQGNRTQGSSTPVDFKALFSKAKQNWRYAAFWLKDDQATQVMAYLMEITSLKIDAGWDTAYSDYLSAKNEGTPQTKVDVYHRYSVSCQKSAVEIFAAVMDKPGIARSMGEILPMVN